MREILFRGKQKNNGEWVEGFYVMHSASIGHPYSYTDGKHCIQTVPHNIQYEVDPETVCQYTGMTDKNGRKIFEGDIVSAWSEGSHAIGRVKQRIDGLWLLYPAWQKEIMWGLCPNNKGETTVEVIGNIFDNPELLEVQNETD